MKRLALARSTVDRSGEIRLQPQQLDELWARAKVFRVRQNHFEGDSDGNLIFLEHHGRHTGERYFLGIDDGIAYFAVRDESDEVKWTTLREVGHLLSDRDVGLITHAIALVNWHTAHTHCPRCGTPTTAQHGGSTRRCVEDGTEHYPRTDPAVIVLVRDDQDRILLGRQKVWPEKRYSTFAGFVEPGESFESAVVREVREEAGVEVTDIRYLGSQPWPFPASIMIAYSAVAINPQSARADGEEIESILWLSRSELKAALEAGDLLLPPSISIARQMIEAWYGSALDGGQAWR